MIFLAHMKNKCFSVTLITFLFFSHLNINAQVTADFSSNPAAGCSPLKVNFSNLSSGSGTLSYTWYLGEQQGVSTLVNPQATYINPGTYEVKLVVTNGTDKDSISSTIVVYQNPVADFTANAKGCIPHTAYFTDLSQPGDGQITGWNWDFRDGATDTRQNPSRDYNTAGKYNVYLVVTDANGCKSIPKEETAFIDVADPPVASFTPSPASSCRVPVTVSFSNTSTGLGILTYNWNFGDNGESSLKNPSNAYSQFGNYRVNLSVNSDYGCYDTISGTLNISEVISAGTLMQSGKPISNNDTICAGQVTFSSSSSGSDIVLWKFGDGKTSISKSGFHVYSQGGSYTVLLIASPGNDCADTVSWKFYMEEPRAEYTMSSNYSCKSPALVNFTDNSTDVIAWEWTFADGTKVATRNASKTYTLQAETDVYKINTNVIFNTILTVTSRHGCKNSATKAFRIKKPTAIFSVDSSQGCFPFGVNYTDRSLSDETITNWEWIFGDGQKSSGVVDSAIHSYTSDGLFLSRLVITNNLGCTDTSCIIPVRAGKKLLPDFSISKTSVCPGEAIQFTDNTPQSNLIQSWHYTVDGISINSIPGESDPLWNVDADSGYLDVGLQVNYNGCVSSTVKNNTLFNNGAVSDFAYTVDCSAPFTYHFTDLSKGSESLKWLFGDNTSDDVTVNPVHTYASEGNFQVELVAYKGLCTDTARDIIKVRNPQALIAGSTVACTGEPVILKGVDSYTQVDYCFEKYHWDFGDTTQNISTRSDSIIHIFASRGTFPVKLKTHFDNGCIDSALISIRVYGPYANFNVDTSYGCSPFEVNFTDMSIPDTHPIESWYWDFADESDTTYSSEINVLNHSFMEPGVFNVILSVTDTLGCTGYYTKTISSANPVAEFLADNPLNCTGSEMKFYYNYLTGDSVIWNFGDGFVSRSNVMPISHTFTSRGDKSVTLTIYKYGCSDTYTNPDGYIKIQQADATFNVSDTAWNCYPKEIIFTHNPVDTIIQAGTWNFGYGNSTSDYAGERRFNYPKPGIYVTGLSIETNYGCIDSDTQNITITGPTGAFTISPENRKACRGDEITLSITDTNNVYDFEWDMGDGRFLDGDPVTYVYERMGELYPKLILYGDNGICIPPPVVDTLLIYEVIAGIELPDTGYCDQNDILFGNSSTGNNTSIWNFSNDSTSTENEPVVRFSTGNYTVELLVLNDIGCSDTLQESFVINPQPEIDLSPDTLICVGDAITIRATGGDMIQWSPSTGLSVTNTYSPRASPESAIVYTAIVRYIATGCRNSDRVSIQVQQEPDITVRPYPDTTIIIGEIISIVTDSLSDITYLWSPADWLSCSTCSSPVAQPLASTLYSITIADTNNCFTKQYNLNIEVIEEYSLHVPAAFTPNGDGVNDMIFVKGWGIRKLLEFRIYNRWGNEVFFSDDLNRGWDGMFNGKIQNIDTYVYNVTVELWNGKTESKKGTITLLR
jgi:gliding motility-associated-like protein